MVDLGLEFRSYFFSSTLCFLYIVVTGISTCIYKSCVTNLEFMANNTANTVAYWNPFSTSKISFILSSFPSLYCDRFPKCFNFHKQILVSGLEAVRRKTTWSQKLITNFIFPKLSASRILSHQSVKL